MTQTNLALKKLQGIKPKGVKPRLENTDLEKLIDLGNYFIDSRSCDFSSRAVGVGAKYRRKFNKEFDNLITKYTLNNDLLTNVIHASYQDLSGKEALIFGLYSGFLLTELTKRKHKNKKLSVFYFNGMGNRFDNLFYLAKRVDVLILDNLVGNDAGISLGCEGGKLGVVAGANLTGENIFSDLNFHYAGCKAFFAYNINTELSTNNIVLANRSYKDYFQKGDFVFMPRRKNHWDSRFYNKLSDLNKSDNELDILSSDELFNQFNPTSTQKKTWNEMRAGKMFDLLRILSKDSESLESNLKQIALMSQGYWVKRNYEY
ncbi:hypothetical protein HOK51_07830 [Candidatus Woesearchaeota archaeon]|jgi:hypothetical protein|nr:hypothetical protein [Candidatus Woesearchaeota archaeon]MBT6519734.1 hypothetical protein [Candidatus Woesearchaeota archaeon]MBT7368114.1 hypothetical protein [Candidatus Woesearchaeota archaeon]